MSNVYCFWEVDKRESSHHHLSKKTHYLGIKVSNPLNDFIEIARDDLGTCFQYCVSRFKEKPIKVTPLTRILYG